MQDFITVEEAAKMLLVTPVHVRRLAKDGKITSQRTTPRKIRISLASVEAYIDANNDNKQ